MPTTGAKGSGSPHCPVSTTNILNQGNDPAAPPLNIDNLFHWAILIPLCCWFFCCRFPTLLLVSYALSQQIDKSSFHTLMLPCTSAELNSVVHFCLLDEIPKMIHVCAVFSDHTVDMSWHNVLGSPGSVGIGSAFIGPRLWL